MFSLTLNTTFLNGDPVILGRKNLEKAHRNSALKHFAKDFEISLEFISLRKRNEMRSRRMSENFHISKKMTKSYFQERRRKVENPCYVCELNMDESVVTCSVVLIFSLIKAFFRNYDALGLYEVYEVRIFSRK